MTYIGVNVLWIGYTSRPSIPWAQVTFLFELGQFCKHRWFSLSLYPAEKQSISIPGANLAIVDGVDETHLPWSLGTMRRHQDVFPNQRVDYNTTISVLAQNQLAVEGWVVAHIVDGDVR